MKRKAQFGRTTAGLLLFCLLAWNGLSGREAFALLGDTEQAFGLNGSLRTLFFHLDQDGTWPYSGKNVTDALSQTILRVTAGGKPTEHLSYEIHWLQDLTLSTEKLTGGSPLGFGGGSTGNVFRYRSLDAAWNVLDNERSLSTASFDRLNAKAALGWGDVTVGRQAITFGKTYFWNPADVFFPFGATQFDRDYKPGVDAVRVDVPFGRFSGMNLIGSAGPRIGLGTTAGGGNDPQDSTWYGSALLTRFYANASGWDFSLQQGKIYGGWHVSAGAVGDIGPVQVRGEAFQFLAMKSDPLPAPLIGPAVKDGFLGVFGLGHRFENSLSLDFEYFYNGVGDPDNLNAALARVRLGSALQMSRNLVGLSARYEFTPIVVGQLGYISSLSDGSTQLQPSVTFSLTNEMDLLAGTIINFGPPPKTVSRNTQLVQSEFGTVPDIVYLEWKWYF